MIEAPERRSAQWYTEQPPGTVIRAESEQITYTKVGDGRWLRSSDGGELGDHFLSGNSTLRFGVDYRPGVAAAPHGGEAPVDPLARLVEWEWEDAPRITPDDFFRLGGEHPLPVGSKVAYLRNGNSARRDVHVWTRDADGWISDHGNRFATQPDREVGQWRLIKRTVRRAEFDGLPVGAILRGRQGLGGDDVTIRKANADNEWAYLHRAHDDPGNRRTPNSFRDDPGWWAMVQPWVGQPPEPPVREEGEVVRGHAVNVAPLVEGGGGGHGGGGNGMVVAAGLGGQVFVNGTDSAVGWAPFLDMAAYQQAVNWKREFAAAAREFALSAGLRAEAFDEFAERWSLNQDGFAGADDPVTIRLTPGSPPSIEVSRG